MSKDFSELFEEYSNNNIRSLEGRRGVVELCKVASLLGYKDPQYFGQLDRGAVIGDLINMLEDNSGLIQAMLDHISTSGNYNPEWKDRLMEACGQDESDDEGESDE
jgi:hypothetical protein